MTRATSLLCSLCCFAAILVANARHFHSIAGPYSIQLKRFSPCEGKFGDAQFEFHEARTHRSQKTRISGKATIPFMMNHTLQGCAAFATWSNVAGWRENAIVVNLKDPFKQFRRFLPNLWDDAANNIFGQSGLERPLFGGEYNFRNFTVEIRDTPVKSWFYGHWRMRTTLTFPSGSPAACLLITFDSLPK